MSCLKRSLLILAGIAALCAGLLGGALIMAGKWLPDSDVPVASDAIVVLAGDVRRTLYAADLMRAGHAPKVLVSRAIRSSRDLMLEELGIHLPRMEEIDRQVLLRKGVPATAIEIFGQGSISTFEEALVLRKVFAGQTPRLLVVTSPYHVRRARLILTRALPQAQINVIATPYETFPERWWTSQDAARDLLLETAKLAFYALGGRFTAATAP
jgi:uncharacterized SAM-binding protein YcdF (DUF218 family)